MQAITERSSLYWIDPHIPSTMPKPGSWNTSYLLGGGGPRLWHHHLPLPWVLVYTKLDWEAGGLALWDSDRGSRCPQAVLTVSLTSL